jgi:hypothetical protein
VLESNCRFLCKESCRNLLSVYDQEKDTTAIEADCEPWDRYPLVNMPVRFSFLPEFDPFKVFQYVL